MTKRVISRHILLNPRPPGEFNLNLKRFLKIPLGSFLLRFVYMNFYIYENGGNMVRIFLKFIIFYVHSKYL